MLDPVTQADIESILASMTRSTKALEAPRTSDTVVGANRNIVNCRNWLKSRGIVYHYDQGSRTYKLGSREVESGNNQT